MTPTDFFDSFVLRNYEDFRNHENSVRLGFNAVISTFQLADHIYHYLNRHEPVKISAYPHKGKYFDYIDKKCPAFKDIRSIANSYKHLYYKNVKASVASTGAVESVDFSAGGMRGIHTSSSEHVFYKKKTGGKVKLITTIKKVIEFWEKELRRRS